MPPPMSEKQVLFSGFPIHISMYGSKVVVLDNSSNLYHFDAE